MKKVTNKQPLHVRFSTVQLITMSFLLVVLIGTCLLSLPIATVSGKSSGLDALFVATSCVCVTGLTTVNTAAHWSLFGKIVMMCLIEIGGMSFMLMTLILAMVTRKKINLHTRLILKDSLNLGNQGGVLKLGLYVVKFSFTVQLIGAILLFKAFYPKFGLQKGLFYSIFHAVSAFCNAGFDLFGNSLEGFQTQPYVLMVISLLIISGGIGFVVWRDLFQWFYDRRLMLHTRLSLIVTLSLLIGGFVVFLLLEGNLSAYKDSLTPFQRVVNTFFLAVTPRTAGFNSIPYTELSQASLLITMGLMFIGGNSGSTAGGLKTSTLGVLILHAWSTIQGKEATVFHERTISRQIVLRAFALFFLCTFMAIFAIEILTITETIPTGYGIEYIAFEVFSAFGTVGVTLGLTPHLTLLGKIVIMLLMFIGRVGVYTFLLSIAKKQRAKESLIRFPEEHIMIG